MIRGYPGLKPWAILYRHFMALTGASRNAASEFRLLRQAKRLRTLGAMRVVEGRRPPPATHWAKEDRAPGTIGSIVPI